MPDDLKDGTGVNVLMRLMSSGGTNAIVAGRVCKCKTEEWKTEDWPTPGSQSVADSMSFQVGCFKLLVDVDILLYVDTMY